MRIFLFKIPEKEYNFDEYMNNSDLNYLKHFNGAIRKKKIYGILLQKFVIKLNYNIPYNEIFIKKNEYDKPYYNKNFHYNLSYSKDYIIIAYSHSSEIGIDIQYESKNIENILIKYGNRNDIMKNNTEDNVKIWTKIESYLKMIGYGLIKLNNIRILSNNNIIDKTIKKNFIQKDISNYLPNNTYGTITTRSCIEKIFFYNINVKNLLYI